MDNVPVLCQVSADKARIGQYEKEAAEKVKAASRSLFEDITHPSSTSAFLDGDPWSEYFGTAYSLFDEEDTAEMETTPDDPIAFPQTVPPRRYSLDPEDLYESPVLDP